MGIAPHWEQELNALAMRLCDAELLSACFNGRTLAVRTDRVRCTRLPGARH